MMRLLLNDRIHCPIYWDFDYAFTPISEHEQKKQRNEIVFKHLISYVLRHGS